MVLSDFDFALELQQKLGFPQHDGHAAAIETSRVMDIAPNLVKGEANLACAKCPVLMWLLTLSGTSQTASTGTQPKLTSTKVTP
jgi:hypothetical protein